MERQITRRNGQTTIRDLYSKAEWKSIDLCAKKIILLLEFGETDIDTIKKRSGIKNLMMFNSVINYINQNTEYRISLNRRGSPDILCEKKSLSTSGSKSAGRSIEYSLKDSRFCNPEIWNRRETADCIPDMVEYRSSV